MKTFLKAAITFATLGALVWLENRRPLRSVKVSKFERDTRNLAIGAVGALSTMTVEKPMVNWLARRVEQKHWGILPRLAMPQWLRITLAVVLLDHTLFLWHILTHRVSLLWKFHAVHHSDLEMDASTGIRFHFGELILSIAWRSGQVLMIGVSPRALALWQNLLIVSVLFHHSNLRLPYEWEKGLANFLVTPRMHGIHHSLEPAERNRNWSSGLSIWDQLHGTFLLDTLHDDLNVGIEGLHSSQDTAFANILLLPFTTGPERMS